MIGVLELFAGVGGFRIGLERAGFRTVFANDFAEPCKATYDANFSDPSLVIKDIRKLSASQMPKFDLVAGGFPCQAFSVAGYREGFRDHKGRGNLFFEIMRLIEEADILPEVVFLENVKNLQTHGGGRTYRIIRETLGEFGYFVEEKVLNSMEYGNTPQTRERIFIVAFRSIDAFNRFSFPPPVPLAVNFCDLLEKSVDEKYHYEGKPLHAKLKDEVTQPGEVYQWRRKYVRRNKKGVCPTLTANMGTGGHNVPIIFDPCKPGIRKLTPRECFRLQGFPDDFVLPTDLADCHLYKQAGNAVTVTVVEAIARQIRFALEESSADASVLPTRKLMHFAV